MIITLEVRDEVYALLAVLDPAGNVQNVLETVIDHVQQGVYRPGAWERGWLEQIYPPLVEDWRRRLEPGDPYGRPDSPMFRRPRKRGPR